MSDIKYNGLRGSEPEAGPRGGNKNKYNLAIAIFLHYSPH